MVGVIDLIVCVGGVREPVGPPPDPSVCHDLKTSPSLQKHKLKARTLREASTLHTLKFLNPLIKITIALFRPPPRTAQTSFRCYICRRSKLKHH